MLTSAHGADVSEPAERRNNTTKSAIFGEGGGVGGQKESPERFLIFYALAQLRQQRTEMGPERWEERVM